MDKLAVSLGGTMNGIGNFANTTTPGTTLNRIVSIGIGVLTVVAAIWFLFLLMTGSISYMTAGGDKGKVEEARHKIFTAMIGLVIVVSAVFLADVVGDIIGINIMDPGGLLMGL